MSHYTKLTLQDRRRLATFLEMKLLIAEIASRMEYHRSTLYRELKRNTKDDLYKFGVAHCKTMKRTQRKCAI